jgi:CP family cyanate transporter-like MFS transporter
MNAIGSRPVRRGAISLPKLRLQVTWLSPTKGRLSGPTQAGRNGQCANADARADRLSHPAFWLVAVLLWLAGNALRLTILAIPPVLPDIHKDLGLSATEIGILGGLPVMLFACAALPGSLLIARLGAVRALLTGLLLTAIGGGLRGVFPTVYWLYLMTIVTGLGVAIMQPSMPALVRQWAPTRIGFATAVYTNGLLAGEVFPVLLTLPVVLPLAGGSWRLDLAAWSLPVLAIAGLVALAARPNSTDRAAVAARPSWWPNWRDPLIWRLGLILGAANAMYFGGNTFLPDYLASSGRSDLIAGALTALNFGQLPASFLLLVIAGRVERRIWPYIVCGLMALAGVVGVASTASLWTVVCAGGIGFACAGVLTLALALPALLSKPEDVARTSAAVFTISYALAMIAAVVSGAAWDASGIPSAAFVPIGLCALLLLALPPTIPFARRAGSEKSLPA